MSRRRRLGFFVVLVGGAAALFSTLRRVSLHQAAEAIAKLPRGAMAIRRESFLDLTVPGRPFRQTVFIAETADQSEVIAGTAEDLSSFEDGHEPDPGADNASATMTDLEPGTRSAEDDLDAASLHAEAAAVLAEAERVEEEAAADHTVDDDLAADAELEAAMTAPEGDEPVPTDSEDTPTDEATVAEEETIEDEPEPVVPQVPAIDGTCPIGHPIKVRFATGRYHEPGSPAYENVVADACYLSVDAAQADGFSASPL